LLLLYAVSFIQALSHTKGSWAGKPFELIDWQEQIVRDIFGILKPNGYRQFNTAYVEIPKKQGKSELAAAIALLLTCGDGEERAEVYGCAADRQQASIVFEVAADMVRMCPALSRRVKILASTKRLIYLPTNSFYQVLSAEAYSKHGFNIHGVVFDELHTQPKKKHFSLAMALASQLVFLLLQEEPKSALLLQVLRQSLWTRCLICSTV
jgi:phage terminase large subunit-like protein